MSETLEHQEKSKAPTRPNRASRRKSYLYSHMLAPTLFCRRCDRAFVAIAAERCQCKVAKPTKSQ
jgi:hypothetical protein